MVELNSKTKQNPPRTAAALDLGSNTLRLIVAQAERAAHGQAAAEAAPWRYRVLARDLATPRLGRGLATGAKLDETAKQAALKGAAKFVGRARELGAQSVVLAASQACRKATDGADFVGHLGQALSLDSARIISGAEEARLSRLGVLSRLTGGTEGAWLADVGGGSCEVMPLSLGETKEPLSLELGAVSLSEMHVKSDPPTPAELEAAQAYALKVLQPIQEMPIQRMVATAGTAATLASLLLGLARYVPERIDNLPISQEELEQQISRLASLPLAERKKVTGLEPERADIILAGLIILKSLLITTKTNRLTVMDAGLLEGILLDSLEPRP